MFIGIDELSLNGPLLDVGDFHAKYGYSPLEPLAQLFCRLRQRLRYGENIAVWLSKQQAST